MTPILAELIGRLIQYSNHVSSVSRNTYTGKAQQKRLGLFCGDYEGARECKLELVYVFSTLSPARP